MPIVDQCGFLKIFARIKTAIIAQNQRPIYGWMRNRAPEVDDLKAFSKENWSFVGKIVVESGNGICSKLIDMDDC